MVGSVQSNPVGPAQAGVTQRSSEQARPREAGGPGAAPQPSVRAGSAELALVRENLWRAIGVLELSVGSAREASQFLNQARAAVDENPAAVAAAFARFQDTIEQGIAAGGAVLAGETLQTLADTQGGLIEIAGEDLRLAPAVAQAAQAGFAPADAGPLAAGLLERADGAAARFSAAASRLVSHEQTLVRLEGAVPAAPQDLDAETALLAALQVSQELAASGQAIGGGASSNILSLFRG